MSFWRAPMAMRMPISRVRSVTETSMMFMMPMPPTSSEIEAMAPSRMDMVRTTTAVALSSSASERNRPVDTSRDRTSDQLVVVPVRVVVQLAVPWTSDTEVVETPATACTSGATLLDSRAATSVVVRVDAVPKPPRVPVLASVVLPGDTTNRLVPSSLIWSLIWAWAPWPRPTVRTTALMPMRMPSMVSAERSRWVRTASNALRSVSRQLMSVPPASSRPAPRFGRRALG
jgi:hypothetical protein